MIINSRALGRGSCSALPGLASMILMRRHEQAPRAAELVFARPLEKGGRRDKQLASCGAMLWGLRLLLVAGVWKLVQLLVFTSSCFKCGQCWTTVWNSPLGMAEREGEPWQGFAQFVRVFRSASSFSSASAHVQNVILRHQNGLSSGRNDKQILPPRCCHVCSGPARPQQSANPGSTLHLTTPFAVQAQACRPRARANRLSRY